MKRSFVLVSSLVFVPALVAPGADGVAEAAGRPLGHVRTPVAYHASAVGAPRRLHPQKARLARRLHAALRHELAGLERGGVVVPQARPLHVRSLIRRQPHRHATRAVQATYSLDELSGGQNVVASGPGEPAYAQADSVGNTVDVWTDPQGRVRHAITVEPGVR
jgi:hypothetical protein